MGADDCDRVDVLVAAGNVAVVNVECLMAEWRDVV